ncbi:diol dehydratase reactivase ATPase-like domain-containing protein [Cryptosporangium japonicum]|uniref:diol dehydratase reactivase ATPase-like domain-containing protein n=1 Tax=Cryptosporangium japonicum TaxID=80872 RepID=UPI0031D0A510
MPEPAPDTGRFAVLAAGVTSPGGTGVGVGRPVALTEIDSAGGAPVVALVSAGYREAAARLNELLENGAPIVAVLLAEDEARLVANRLDQPVPVIDGVDLSVAADATLVAVEVVASGRPLRKLTDPLFLASEFGADAAENDLLRGVARQLADVSSAAVAVAVGVGVVNSGVVSGARIWPRSVSGGQEGLPSAGGGREGFSSAGAGREGLSSAGGGREGLASPGGGGREGFSSSGAGREGLSSFGVRSDRGGVSSFGGGTAGVPAIEAYPAAGEADGSSLAGVRSDGGDVLSLGAGGGAEGHSSIGDHRTGGEAILLREAARRLGESGPGAFAAYTLDGEEVLSVADLAVVDIGALAKSLLVRTGAGNGGYALAALAATTGPIPADALLAEALGVPVVSASSEAAAARSGALTTPGAPPDAVVVDIGGGTVDVIGPDGERVLAGGGDLLTAAVALGLDVTRGAAEWAKRGPAVRVETPQLASQENGDRTFLEAPQPAGTVGWLAAPGPAGLLPITVRLGPAEWRTFRLAMKQAVLGTAVRRGLGRAGTVLVVGGPAGDDEVLRVVDEVLPPGAGLGRGNVAGSLGHRYAVAWGLALALCEEA